MSHNPEPSQKVFDLYFRKFHKKALVFIRSSKEALEDFDPFSDTGYTIKSQNSLTVKILTKTITSNNLILKELGLVESGAIQIILHKRDVTLIKNSRKILINNIEYYVFNNAVGNRFQIFSTDYSDYPKIILFRKQVEGGN